MKLIPIFRLFKANGAAMCRHFKLRGELLSERRCCFINGLCIQAQEVLPSATAIKLPKLLHIHNDTENSSSEGADP